MCKINESGSKDCSQKQEDYTGECEKLLKKKIKYMNINKNKVNI